nr:MAG TPA: hypothetical protein [Caudoviricetes sp.]
MCTKCVHCFIVHILTVFLPIYICYHNAVICAIQYV